MIRIVDVREVPELLADAVNYFWEQWGSDSNLNFYKDCIENSCATESDIPRFYLALEDQRVIGAYALLRSDLNSRQDLFPWFACLYVDPEHRGHKLGAMLQDHAIQQAGLKGYDRLYLCTDLTEYYERNHWKYIGEGYSIGGEEMRIYEYRMRD
jgi:GNAT superfamily N-acetyltransferase